MVKASVFETNAITQIEFLKTLEKQRVASLNVQEANFSLTSRLKIYRFSKNRKIELSNMQYN